MTDELIEFSVFSCRYQIVVEIIHATTISSLPQLKKQKGRETVLFKNITDFILGVWTKSLALSLGLRSYSRFNLYQIVKLFRSIIEVLVLFRVMV